VDHEVIERREIEFLLYDFLDAEELCERPRFAEHGRETFDAALDTANEIARRYFADHNAALDRDEPSFDGERVSILPEVKDAIRAFAEAGFLAAHRDEAEGGMQLPWLVTQACFAHFQAANISTAAYPFLTIAAANLLDAFGSQEQKALYMAPMLDGRFFGTMALSEPQAGSSLADIRTSAEPTDQGHYRLKGSKMWISGGEHDLSDNIVHLVLAKIAGAPPGVKGISLFVVPKFLVGADGALGARNDVRLMGLNHKMGYRGTVNTALSLGEAGDCIGYLVGEPHQGLGYMFHMMNEARIGVGLGAAMLGYAGYRYSRDYAAERPQGRRASDKDPAAPQVPIIEHADIRRMLLAQKATAEGAMALCLYAARLVDDQRSHPDEAGRSRAGLLLDLLTPIVKSWPSERCLEANSHAIQILGGYGYTREYPVEQIWRDNRLNPIHEGTTGIQAMDLLGRKAGMAGGAAWAALADEIGQTVAAAKATSELADYASDLAEALAGMTETTARLLEVGRAGEVERQLANASLYLDAMGNLVVAWIWLRQALAAQAGLAAGPGVDARNHLRGKLQACRYFFRWELSRIGWQRGILDALDDTCLAAKPAWF
jgi:butyryl-CoA dehydrogenase